MGGGGGDRLRNGGSGWGKRERRGWEEGQGHPYVTDKMPYAPWCTGLAATFALCILYDCRDSNQPRKCSFTC